MSAYNFLKRFAPAVRDGLKRQTIRAHRKDGRVPKVGEQLQLYTGMRTKHCTLLIRARCRKVQRIRVAADRLELDDVTLTRVDADAFARADGFSCYDELVSWFTIERRRELPWFGIVVYW